VHHRDDFSTTRFRRAHRITALRRAMKAITFGLIFTLFFSALSPRILAQAAETNRRVESTASKSSQAPENNLSLIADENLPQTSLRVERIPVAGGAELLTIFGSVRDVKSRDSKTVSVEDVPLVSIVRDTLGDDNPNNDKLRYVWMLTYARPTLLKRITAAVPFLYGRLHSQSEPKSNSAPPFVIDLADQNAFNRFFWSSAQTLFFNSFALPVIASSRTYRRNVQDYRKDHLYRALAILALYDAAQKADEKATPLFSRMEVQDIQARLMLSDSLLGGIVDETKLDDAYEQRARRREEQRGHNWEILRQRAEAENLIFEPLTLPDGSATHALLWVAPRDVSSESNKDRRFDARFLNIADPFHDERLRNWKGYSEVRYFDAHNRPTTKDASDARAVELIPLALYGLDHPKIPILLTDFRDANNPKVREASQRAIEDVARNILDLSPFGDIPYFLGRTGFNFLTRRKGRDFNQPTRLRAYSQLKLLLALNASLPPALRDELNRRADRVSLNPLGNNFAAEIKIARQQYAALMDYARRPDGLAAQIARDRRAELVPETHTKKAQAFFEAAHIATFGIYKHRENLPPADVTAKLDAARQLAAYRRFLREVSDSTPLVEVVWNIEDVRRALRYIAEHGKEADPATAAAVSKIFAQTQDNETRRLCLASLYRINNDAAKSELVKIYRAPAVQTEWRELSMNYLQKAFSEGQRIAPEDAKIIAETKKQ
jgi:hypothetical protein